MTDVSQLFAALCVIALMFMEFSDGCFPSFGFHTIPKCWEEKVIINCLSLELLACLQEALDIFHLIFE